MGEALRFRHRLVPYLHSMNHRAAHGEPLVQPMYYDHPEIPAAYQVPRQFLFGDSLLVAPITDPDDAVTMLGATTMWLPEGRWADIFTGTLYSAGPGGRFLTLHRDGQSIPALVKAGATVPLATDYGTHVDQNPDSLDLILLVGADGTRELVEDDGTGSRSADIPTSRTTFTWDDEGQVMTIGAARKVTWVPERRTYHLRVLGLESLESVTGDAVIGEIGRDGGGFTVTLADVPTDTGVSVRLHGTRGSAAGDRQTRLYDMLARAQWDHMGKWAAWNVLETDASDLDKIGQLQSLGLPPTLLGALVEIVGSDHR